MACVHYPGIPADSMLLAKVTSLDQTSNSHLCNPTSPLSTDPECIPTLMFRSTPVIAATLLRLHNHVIH